MATSKNSKPKPKKPYYYSLASGTRPINRPKKG